MTPLHRFSSILVISAGLFVASHSALAMSEARGLEAGVSPHFSIQGVERFSIDIESPSHLVVQPRVWAGTTPGTIRLRAVVTDASGNIVAEGRPSGDLFHLESPLSPGRYTLEVSGRHLGGPVESSGHYRLLTRYEF